MRKSIDYMGAKVSYDIQGSGETLAFLHGYLESLEIWEGFAGRFNDRYQVLCLDIPGHGQSGVFSEIHMMDEMATVLKTVLEAEEIEKATIIGHSMGGYVTMSFVSMYPEMLSGYVLFHSTCFADNEEKRLNRDREISLVRQGRKEQLILLNIPRAFADEHVQKLEAKVNRAKEIASACDDDGVISLLEGMKRRHDYSESMKNSAQKPMLIYGEKDNYITLNVFMRLNDLVPDAYILKLKNSGHMGFIEEADAAYKGIISYLHSL